eukprot:scaffold155445_cov31-Tisochrysis_lutea.AAC.5
MLPYSLSRRLSGVSLPNHACALLRLLAGNGATSRWPIATGPNPSTLHIAKMPPSAASRTREFESPSLSLHFSRRGRSSRSASEGAQSDEMGEARSADSTSNEARKTLTILSAAPRSITRTAPHCANARHRRLTDGPCARVEPPHELLAKKLEKPVGVGLLARRRRKRLCWRDVVRRVDRRGGLRGWRPRGANRPLIMFSLVASPAGCGPSPTCLRAWPLVGRAQRCRWVDYQRRVVSCEHRPSTALPPAVRARPPALATAAEVYPRAAAGWRAPTAAAAPPRADCPPWRSMAAAGGAAAHTLPAARVLAREPLVPSGVAALARVLRSSGHDAGAPCKGRQLSRHHSVRRRRRWRLWHAGRRPEHIDLVLDQLGRVVVLARHRCDFLALQVTQLDAHGAQLLYANLESLRLLVVLGRHCRVLSREELLQHGHHATVDCRFPPGVSNRRGPLRHRHKRLDSRSVQLARSNLGAASAHHTDREHAQLVVQVVLVDVALVQQQS